MGRREVSRIAWGNGPNNHLTISNLQAAVTSMFAIAITSRVLIFAEKASRAGYTLGCSLYRALMPYLIGIRYEVIFL